MTTTTTSESTTPTDKLLQDLKTVVEDAEALLQATAAQTGERIDTVRSRARESLQRAKTRLAEAEGEARAQAREVAASTDAYVRENPWQAVGIAAGFALLLGLLISRR
jgi:ElaB/YqjD/DUF883 family membrane-anchored ribosome-binding protein